MIFAIMRNLDTHRRDDVMYDAQIAKKPTGQPEKPGNLQGDSKEMPKSYGRNILGGARANPHPLQSPPPVHGFKPYVWFNANHTCGLCATIRMIDLASQEALPVWRRWQHRTEAHDLATRQVPPLPVPTPARKRHRLPISGFSLAMKSKRNLPAG